jgi:hypothetical protein
MAEADCVLMDFLPSRQFEGWGGYWRHRKAIEALGGYLRQQEAKGYFFSHLGHIQSPDRPRQLAQPPRSFRTRLGGAIHPFGLAGNSRATYGNEP